MRRAIALLTLAALALLAPAAQADFGINDMSAGFFEEEGSPDLKAGSHPYEFRLHFEMNQDGAGKPEGTLRSFVIDLPPGMIGNPLAVPRCTGAQFVGTISHCPGNTQIGVAVAHIDGIEPNPIAPLYNLTPPLGVPASIGFSVGGFNILQEARLRPADYGIKVSDLTFPTGLALQSVSASVWGLPPAVSHDPDRTCFPPGGEGESVEGCSSDLNPIPFLTLPTSCGAPLRWTLSVESLQEPGVLQSASDESRNESGEPAGLNGCEGLPFDPDISSKPETAAPDSPTGLHFGLTLPQDNEPQQPSEPRDATAHLRDATVTLPAGLALNPSTADGRGACPLTGPEGINLPGSGEPLEGEPAKCPANSKVGTVTVTTPLLDHPVQGNVYLARQGENPFGSLFALYIAVDDPQTGVVVKLAGRLEPDLGTGQIKATFQNNPQVPFEDFDFSFPGGSRAPLTTPPTCGTYTTTTTLTPWSAPAALDAIREDSFPVKGGCAPSEAQMPNAPSFEAGSESPLAGAYSPFVMRLGRENGSQRFGAVNLTLPPGLAANFSGVAECSDAQVAGALTRNHPGEGALELASPSCPPGSEIGSVDVGAGSGAPFHVAGKAYLAGPYKGAPFSLVVITPAVAGPFDLGAVVVRAALYVNEETGQGTVKSDPLPTILQGIPLDVRTITVKVDRSGYVLNPTSCEAKQVSGEEISTTGQAAHLQNRFQVGGCKGLDYTPKLSLSLKGPTRRDGHPALKSVLTQPSGQANAKRVVVILPPTEFIDPLRTANPCTRPAFAEEKCPPASVLGTAKVFTPLFKQPLEGKVYFRANGGARELPDAVADLHGRVHVVLVGFVDAVHKKGSESSRIRTTFANVPDAPLTKAIVELKGGKKGVLVNSANLCKVPPIATVKMTAQNNRAQDSNTRIGTSCSKK